MTGLLRPSMGISIALLAMMIPTSAVRAAETDKRCFEMRVYYAAPGKLEALHRRFREHTVGLFKKHGMENIGYWTPVENPEQKLIYLLAYPSREAREASWKGFMADADWQKAWKESEKDGKLVAKVEASYWSAVDYSPVIKPSAGTTSRLFELRTYTAAEGKLDALHARFRDHTVGLFSKHGMQHVGYWVPMADQKGSGDTLVYILAHKEAAARDASFDGFRKDPAWVKAREASEKGGSLTAKDGVKSVLMIPTDYSPIR